MWGLKAPLPGALKGARRSGRGSPLLPKAWVQEERIKESKSSWSSRYQHARVTWGMLKRTDVWSSDDLNKDFLGKVGEWVRRLLIYCSVNKQTTK